MERPGRLVVVLTIGLLSLIWGTTWAAIRVGLAGIPPFLGVSLRFAIAAVALFLLGRFMGVRYGSGRSERYLWLANGLLSFCISYGVVYWSEQWVPSGLASVLFATFPLFVALLAHVALPEEPLRLRTLVGVLIGFGGVALIFSEDFSRLGGVGVAFASVMMLASPIASAIASVAIKKWGRGVHYLSVTTVPMAISAVVMGLVSAAVERDRELVWNASSVGALLYLALAGSAVTFSLYYWLLSHLPATRVALVAYLTPVVAVTVGALFMNEPYTIRTLTGSALVLGGVALSASKARRATTLTALAIAFLLPWSPSTAEDEGPVRLPAASQPPAIAALGAADAAAHIATSRDLTRAAAALPLSEDDRRTLVRVVLDAGSPPAELKIDGAVHALCFDSEGRALYVLRVRGATRRDPGETAVLRIDLTLAPRVRASVRVPASARAMDLSAEGNALLVAAKNEIRVVLIPDLLSPRLFRVPGENSAVASLPGGDRVLVGQPEGLVLVDLSDRQSGDGLPIRGRLAMPAPVVALSAAPDGAQAFAELGDGRLFRVDTDTLELRDEGMGRIVGWTGRRAPYAPRSSAPGPARADATSEQEPRERVAEAEVPVQSVPSAPESPPAPALPAAPPLAVEQSHRVPPEVGVAVPAEENAPEPAQQEGLFVRGVLKGPDAGGVAAVVVLGPANLLREAARAIPQPDGSWSVGPLAPGSYRIVLDGGLGGIVVSDPPFATLVLDAGGAPSPIEFRVSAIRKR